MTTKRADETLNRRGFLRAGLGTASVAATTVIGAAQPAQAAENDAERKKARYKETDHVKTFYRTNRY
ncbi:MAG TPA: formate dehydrogenase [Beijerinckiaceae bacterium]|nr:formate dehydrogenase [Beijerinckiaceae bacterium]